jgi:hypothetical protein
VDDADAGRHRPYKGRLPSAPRLLRRSNLPWCESASHTAGETRHCLPRAFSPTFFLSEIDLVAVRTRARRWPDEPRAALWSLTNYQPHYAARADLLARAGQRDEALGAYDRSIELTTNAVARDFLVRQLGAL